MLEDARVYLERVLPWIDGAYANLHFLVPNKRFDPSQPEHPKTNPKSYVNGYAYRTVDEVMAALQYRVMQPETLDMYVCMSAQAHAEEVAGKFGGGGYRRAMRAAANMAGIKSLWIDVDVKPDNDKAYPTPADAQVALLRFIREVGLPIPTLMVSSGTGGMHVYWVLDQIISRDEWQPLADAMAEATRRHGFKCDTQCTVNGAQLLRPPQTWNFKRTPKLPVMLGKMRQPADISVDHMRKVLSPYMGARVLTMPGVSLGNLQAAARHKAQGTSELGAGIQTSAPPIDIKTITGHCGFVRDGLATGGKDYDQPLWNLSTLLATFTEDGRTVAHDLAKGHAAYAPGDTDALYDRKVIERQARNIGWPSCASIANAGCKACGTCQLRPLGKSPLSFGKGAAAVVAHPAVAAANPPLPAPATASAQVPNQQPMPQGYLVDPNGVVSRAIPQPDGSHVIRPICTYPLTRPWLQSTPWTLNFTTEMPGTSKPMPISMQLNNLQSREFAKHLAAQGMVLTRNQVQEVQEFLLSWVQTLQSIKGSVVSSVPFGWSSKDGKMEGFAYNGVIWTPNQPVPAANLGAALAAHYTPVGELSKWQAAADFITGQGRQDLAVILAAGFGAPLVQFTGHEGGVISTWSAASGIGKSTAMKIQQAIWGHPVMAMNALNDTYNSAVNKAGQLQNAPLNWDELKGEDQKMAFAKLVFQFTSGKEKNRMNADSTLRHAGTWTSLMVSASNDPILDAVQEQFRSTEAGILRIFEFEIQPAASNLGAHGQVSRLVGELKDNYGLAGLEYSKFLGANYDRVKREVGTMQDMLIARLQIPNEERFWLVPMVCCIMGARYANELALTKFNVSALTHFLVQTLHTLRASRKTSSVDMSRKDAVINILNHFLADMQARHTMVTDQIPFTRGRPIDCKVLNDVSKLEHLVVRHVPSQKLLIIAKPYFHDWLKKNTYPPNSVVLALQRLLNMRLGVRMMGAGTRWNHEAFKAQVYEIDYSGSDFDFARSN